MNRPALSRALSEPEFQRWYWLKEELATFCRAEGLSASGSKQELASSISAHLASRQIPMHTRRKAYSTDMPSTFELETVIGEGWRCTQALRSFFVLKVGERFGFNEPLRNFIKSGSGLTLAEALAHYQHSLLAGPRPIAEQFEYNNHMREYRKANPSSTHAQAVSAWWEKRGKPSV